MFLPYFYNDFSDYRPSALKLSDISEMAVQAVQPHLQITVDDAHDKKAMGVFEHIIALHTLDDPAPQNRDVILDHIVQRCMASLSRQ